MRLIVLTLLLSFSALSFDIALADAETRPKIRFFCGISDRQIWVDLYKDLYTQAFNDLGYDFEMLYRPQKRVYSDLVRGLADGDCGRVKNLKKITDNDQFVRVDALLLRTVTGIWSYNSSIKHISESDIQSGAYRIGIMRGDLRLTQRLKDYDLELTQVDEIQQGLKMLYSNRIDLFISAKVRVDMVLKTRAKEFSPPFFLGEYLALEIYPYVNIRYKDLAGPLAERLNHYLSDPAHPVHQYSGLSPE